MADDPWLNIGTQADDIFGNLDDAVNPFEEQEVDVTGLSDEDDRFNIEFPPRASSTSLSYGSSSSSSSCSSSSIPRSYSNTKKTPAKRPVKRVRTLPNRDPSHIMDSSHAPYILSNFFWADGILSSPDGVWSYTLASNLDPETIPMLLKIWPNMPKRLEATAFGSCFSRTTLLTIEGAPGVGKSEAMESMQKAFPREDNRFLYIPEPIPEDLADFYEGRISALEFQLRFIVTRYEKYIKFMSIHRDLAKNDNFVVIMDRGPLGDQGFFELAEEASYDFSDPEALQKIERIKQAYHIVVDLFTQALPGKQVIVHLAAGIPTLMKRIKERGRECEKSGISVDYLANYMNKLKRLLTHQCVKVVPILTEDKTIHQIGLEILGYALVIHGLSPSLFFRL